jgi:hypothetical protein
MLGIDLFETSAAASGVGGNTVQALAATRRIEMGALLGNAARTMESIDAEYERQRHAAALQAHFNIAAAVAEIEAAEGNVFDMLGNALLTFGAFKSTGVFDKTVQLGSHPMAGKYQGPYTDSIPPGPGVGGPGPLKGAAGYY